MSRREMEDHERIGMISSMQCAREEPTLYEAPGEKRYFALFGLGLMRLSSAAHNVGTALIWHANYCSGRCDPSLGTLVRETGLSRSSVVRAITELGRKGVLKLQKRWRDGRQISNAHHLAWEKLQRRFLHFQQLVMEHHATRNAEGGSVKSGQRVVSESVVGSVKPDTQTNEGTNEGNQCPKGAHVSKVRDDNVIISSEGKKEEGMQGEPFTDASIIINPPGEMIGPKPLDEFGTAWWSRQEARKLKALKTETDLEKRKDLEAGLARARLRKATQ